MRETPSEAGQKMAKVAEMTKSQFTTRKSLGV